MAFISSISFTGNKAHVNVTNDEFAVSSRHVADRASMSANTKQNQRVHSSSTRPRNSNQTGTLVSARLCRLDTSESESEYDDSQLNVGVTPRQEVFYRPFYEESPETYFLAVELDFEFAGIASQRQKFSHVCKVLEPKHFFEIGSNFPLRTSPTCYDDLKRFLIKRYSPTPAEKFADLFDNLCEGMPPQDLKDKIVNAFGIKSEDSNLEDFKRELFLRHIPNKIAFPLRAFVDDSFEKTADRATAMFSVLSSNATNSHARQTANLCKENERQKPQQSNDAKKSDPKYQSVKSEAASSSKQTDKQTKIGTTLASIPKVSRTDQSFSHSSRQNNFRQRRVAVGGLTGNLRVGPCYYHSTFGFAARKCRAPCAFQNDFGLSDEKMARNFHYF